MDRTAAPAAVALAVYVLNGVAAVLRPGTSLPDGSVYIVTAVPLLGYVAYRLLQGRSYHLWENVGFAVLGLTGALCLFPLAPAAFGLPGGPIPLDYLLATGSPALGFLVVRLLGRAVAGGVGDTS
jgi:hypothetical protein